MSDEYLGLFDTPPSRQEVRLAVTIAVLLFAAFLAVLPISDNRLPEVVAFVPTIDAFVFVAELIVATLLYAQASVFRSRALAVLASGFVFIALLVVPHALTFPGAFAPNGLLGAGVNTTAWTAIFRRIGFPLAVILYAWLKVGEPDLAATSERPPAGVIPGLAVAVGLAMIGSFAAVEAHNSLPAMFVNRSDVVYTNLLIFNLTAIASTSIAALMLFLRRQSVLDLWLLVALAAWLVEAILNVPVHARFTVGFYCLFLLMLISHLILLVALIVESNRLYARLALSTAARAREQETRMMSMDAVASAMSHEVGQPLAAIMLHASASLKWLTRARPNREMAIRSLRDTIEASRRAFDVIRSIRATFSRASGRLDEIDVNRLIHETVSLLEPELAAHGISLQLFLDEQLCPVMGNRVQIQRVILNLLTNAIEALSGTRRRRREISVRSLEAEGGYVLVEVSDSGRGIGPDEMAHIFDPFFTTKASGTGLGLSLSKSIVEEHGGRLWATSGDGGGATFHLRLQRA